MKIIKYPIVPDKNRHQITWRERKLPEVFYFIFLSMIKRQFRLSKRWYKNCRVFFFCVLLYRRTVVSTSVNYCYPTGSITNCVDYIKDGSQRADINSSTFRDDNVIMIYELKSIYIDVMRRRIQIVKASTVLLNFRIICSICGPVCRSQIFIFITDPCSSCLAESLRTISKFLTSCWLKVMRFWKCLFFCLRF